MANIDDVAKAANVSKSTVSNVFSKKRPISKEVSERVLDAARRLSYKPNYWARSLVNKETRIIGLSMQAEKIKFSQFHLALLNGVLKVCYDNGYRLLVNTLSDRFANKLELLASDPVDGEIILDPTVNDERIAERTDQGLPIVVVGRPPKRFESRVSYIDNDTMDTALRATASLLRLGHRSILFLNAPRSRTVSEDRAAGFMKAFEEFGLRANSELIVYKPEGVTSTDFGYAEAKRWLSKAVGVTAVIADTDKIAVGVAQSAAELGLSIPDSLSLFAFGETPGAASGMLSKLSAVQLNAEQLGEEAAKLLLEQIAGGTQLLKRITVPTEIVERGSLAPAPARPNASTD